MKARLARNESLSRTLKDLLGYEPVEIRVQLQGGFLVVPRRDEPCPIREHDWKQVPPLDGGRIVPVTICRICARTPLEALMGEIAPLARDLT